MKPERGELLPTVTFRLIETITLCSTAKRECADCGGEHRRPVRRYTHPPKKKKKKEKRRPNLSVNLKCQGETAGEIQRLNVN